MLMRKFLKYFSKIKKFSISYIFISIDAIITRLLHLSSNQFLNEFRGVNISIKMLK